MPPCPIRSIHKGAKNDSRVLWTPPLSPYLHKEPPQRSRPPTVIGYQPIMFQAYLPKKRKLPPIPYKKKGSLRKSFPSMLNHAVKIHHPIKTKCCYCYTAGFLEPLMGFGAKIDAFSRNVRTRSVG